VDAPLIGSGDERQARGKATEGERQQEGAYRGDASDECVVADRWHDEILPAQTTVGG